MKKMIKAIKSIQNQFSDCSILLKLRSDGEALVEIMIDHDSTSNLFKHLTNESPKYIG